MRVCSPRRRAIKARLRELRRATRTRSRSGAARLSAFQPAAPSQQADFATPAYQPQSFQNAEHPGAQGYPASSYNGAQAYPSQPFGTQNYADAVSRAGIGGCELSPSRASTRILPIRISAIRISPSRILPMPASRVAGLRRKLPRHELSQRAWLRSTGAGHGLRPWRSGRSRLQFLPQRAVAGLRPGAAKRSAAATASLRRHLRSTAADFVGLDRAEPPASAGFL